MVVAPSGETCFPPEAQPLLRFSPHPHPSPALSSLAAVTLVAVLRIRQEKKNAKDKILIDSLVY